MTLDLVASNSYNVDSDNNTATVTIYNNDLPKVSITADQNGDAFAITSNVTLDEPLLVPYTIGGTATNGVDYQLLSGDVIIPSGSNSATVAVTPIADQAGGSHTVTLTLASGSDYTPSQSQGTDTLSITNNQINSQDPSASEFYIGSGGTFLVPTGATTLYLGFHDFQQWDDNWGSVSVSLTWQGGQGGSGNATVDATACLFLAFAPSGAEAQSQWHESGSQYDPVAVTVPTGATGVTITATGTWGNIESDPSQSGGPQGYGGLPQSLTDASWYVCSSLNSQNIVPGSFS